MPDLVCMPVADCRPGTVIPGSVVRPCATCGTQVYVSPAGARVVADLGATVVCLRHGPVPTAHAAVLGLMTADQLRELRSFFSSHHHN